MNKKFRVAFVHTAVGRSSSRVCAVQDSARAQRLLSASPRHALAAVGGHGGTVTLAATESISPLAAVPLALLPGWVSAFSFSNFCSLLFSPLCYFRVYFDHLFFLGSRYRNYVSCLEVFLLPNINVLCHDVSSQHCFSRGPQILFSSSSVYFSILLEVSSVTHRSIKVCCLIFRYVEVVLLFVIDFYFDYTVVIEHTLCDLNFFFNLLRCV